MSYGADKLGVDVHTQQASTIPEGQHWPRVKAIVCPTLAYENGSVPSFLFFVRKTTGCSALLIFVISDLNINRLCLKTILDVYKM